jgi:hypothetical protein
MDAAAFALAATVMVAVVAGAGAVAARLRARRQQRRFEAVLGHQHVPETRPVAAARPPVATTTTTTTTTGEPVITEAGSVGHFSFQWPEGPLEHFTTTARYLLGDREVLVARTTRTAYGRDRGRIVVLGPAARAGALVPWAEFTETDGGTYAARLPNPASPRLTLTDGQRLPARFAGADVRRTDELFATGRAAPMLRLVLGPGDVEGMIRHAAWAGSIHPVHG